MGEAYLGEGARQRSGSPPHPSASVQPALAPATRPSPPPRTHAPAPVALAGEKEEGSPQPSWNPRAGAVSVCEGRYQINIKRLMSRHHAADPRTYSLVHTDTYSCTDTWIWAWACLYCRWWREDVHTQRLRTAQSPGSNPPRTPRDHAPRASAWRHVRATGMGSTPARDAPWLDGAEAC